ncbi:redox-regulated ATPase YchF [Chloroflexota bacterium]
MSIDIGIIGLPQSGKTTVFNALTAGMADTKGRAEGQASHIGVVKVPEPRLWVLNDMFHPRKVVPVETKYLDIGASVKGLAQDKGIGGQLLNQLGNVDSLIAVIPAFDTSQDIDQGITAMNLELAFSDLAIIERRLERIENSMKGAKPPERQGFVRETEVLKEWQARLEKDLPIREMATDPGEQKMIANFQFLTAKPLLLLVNISEDRVAHAASLEAEFNAKYAGDKCRVIVLCGKLEMELARMEAGEAQEFREDYGLKESGLERTIKLSYEISEMICFFTVGEDEVRAWPIRKGTTALKAAGKIHTDIEKGFIRAENIGYEDLIRCGSIAKARKQGLLRLEGKDYVIQDGDVITFLFNV